LAEDQEEEDDVIRPIKIASPLLPASKFSAIHSRKSSTESQMLRDAEKAAAMPSKLAQKAIEIVK